MRWLDDITDSMDEFEQTLGDGERQGSLACRSLWGGKSQTEQQLNRRAFRVEVVFQILPDFQ